MKQQPPPFAAHYRISDDTWQPLAVHLWGVAGLSRLFATKLGMPHLGELIGLLHDLGKYSLAFQAYLKSALGAISQDEDEDWVDAACLKGKVDHSTAGAQWVWRALNAKGEQYQALAQVAALSISSHHSGLIDCIGAKGERFGENSFAARMAKPDEKVHLDEVQRNVDRNILERCNELIHNPALLQEFTRFMHRIGASASAVDEAILRQQQAGLLILMIFSCLIAADREDTAQFARQPAQRPQAHTGWRTLIKRLEFHLASMPVVYDIDRIRREISDHCRDAAGRDGGIYALTVPTGGGKTLASLRFALHHADRRNLDRIVYVIPFTSIIDQNAQIVRSILEADAADAGSVVLEHHSNVTPERETWREKALCETWESPVVYTTMVQFLESLFGAGTRGARRLHQLTNAVIVFDEVQTLPIRCVHLFNNAVNFLSTHCNSTVVLCTATQPLLHQVDKKRGALRLVSDRDLMPNVDENFRRLRRVEVRDCRRAGGWSHRAIADLAVAETLRAGSCLVVTNTKRSARQLYALSRESLDPDELFHLSTNMCPAHRKQVIATIKDRLSRGLRTLCLSTQLIEAGVDVDFGVVVRFLAGLDSIGQAAGRCNRNGRLTVGIVYVVNPNEESLKRLPEIAIGRDVAERVLDDFKASPDRYENDLLSPAAMSDYYRYYFFERQRDMAYTISAHEIGHDDTLLMLLSLNELATAEYHRRAPADAPLAFRQAFMTAASAFEAIDAPTEGVVAPYGKEGDRLINDLFAAYDASREGDLLRRAQQFSVNVTPSRLRQLQQAGAVTALRADVRIQVLDKRHYHKDFGLSETPINPMETLLD